VPELPEVESVRAGLERLAGHRITAVEVFHPRAIRRHAAGAHDFTGRLSGRRIEAVRRRGKYLWLPLDSGEVLLAHLGMSGQLLVCSPDAPRQGHLRAQLSFADPGVQLRYVDQRTFGGLAVFPGDAQGGVPPVIAHVAADPLEPGFDDASFSAALRRRGSGVKRALLDQTLISGVGNIYADEALWRARIHHDRPASSLRPADAARLIGAIRGVLRDALAAGGTTFDGLYVDAEGRSGYFVRELAVYGREGQPCPACGTPVRRVAFMNRSAHFCPRCQRPSRRRAS
jgi:formamidopyrimidine-DNA glycosylase